jgi:hypothetical protein
MAYLTANASASAIATERAADARDQVRVPDSAMPSV